MDPLSHLGDSPCLLAPCCWSGGWRGAPGRGRAARSSRPSAWTPSPPGRPRRRACCAHERLAFSTLQAAPARLHDPGAGAAVALHQRAASAIPTPSGCAASAASASTSSSATSPRRCSRWSRSGRRRADQRAAACAATSAWSACCRRPASRSTSGTRSACRRSRPPATSSCRHAGRAREHAEKPLVDLQPRPRRRGVKAAAALGRRTARPVAPPSQRPVRRHRARLDPGRDHRGPRAGSVDLVRRARRVGSPVRRRPEQR